MLFSIQNDAFIINLIYAIIHVNNQRIMMAEMEERNLLQTLHNIFSTMRTFFIASQIVGEKKYVLPMEMICEIFAELVCEDFFKQAEKTDEIMLALQILQPYLSTNLSLRNKFNKRLDSTHFFSPTLIALMEKIGQLERADRVNREEYDAHITLLKRLIQEYHVKTEIMTPPITPNPPMSLLNFAFYRYNQLETLNKVIPLLLLGGANPNIPFILNEDGPPLKLTPLTMACALNNTFIVSELMRYGADPNPSLDANMSSENRDELQRKIKKSTTACQATFIRFFAGKEKIVFAASDPDPRRLTSESVILAKHRYT